MWVDIGLCPLGYLCFQQGQTTIVAVHMPMLDNVSVSTVTRFVWSDNAQLELDLYSILEGCFKIFKQPKNLTAHHEPFHARWQ